MPCAATGLTLSDELCCVLVAADKIGVWSQRWSLGLGTPVHALQVASERSLMVIIWPDQPESIDRRSGTSGVRTGSHTTAPVVLEDLSRQVAGDPAATFMAASRSANVTRSVRRSKVDIEIDDVPSASTAAVESTQKTHWLMSRAS